MNGPGARPDPLWLDGVEVLFCALDHDGDISLQAARASLDAAEAARAGAFRLARDRDRFIRGRGFLRRAVAQRLGCSPVEVPLSTGAMGKPHLAAAGPEAPGGPVALRFSLSHADGLAALALSHRSEVGLDIELAGRRPGGEGGVDALIDLCFGPDEAAAIRAAPDPEARFLRFWTAKEARMKLTGEGMALPPRAIALVLRDGEAVGYARPDTPVALLRSFVAGGAVGSLARAEVVS